MAVTVAADVAYGLVPVVVRVCCAHEIIVCPIIGNLDSASFLQCGKDFLKGKVD